MNWVVKNEVKKIIFSLFLSLSLIQSSSNVFNWENCNGNGLCVYMLVVDTCEWMRKILANSNFFERKIMFARKKHVFSWQLQFIFDLAKNSPKNIIITRKKAKYFEKKVIKKRVVTIVCSKRNTCTHNYRRFLFDTHWRRIAVWV